MILKRILIIVLLGSLAVGSFFAIRKVVELTENRSRTFGQETLVQRGFTPLGQWGKRDTERREESGEVIVIGAEEVRIVKDTDFFQKGDIIVKDNGKLIFQNSVVEITPGEAPRANIFVRDNGELVFENSTLKPHSDDPANLYIYLSDEARFVFKDSQGIHMIFASGSSEIKMDNSIWAYTMPNFRGGGVQLRDKAQAHITNSTIGGLVLELPQEAQVDIRDFQAGKFEDFDFARDFSSKGVGFNVVLKNSEILGDYLEGGSERGLAIFAPSNISKLTITGSTLNKLVITSTNENLTFSGLDLGVERDFAYKNINLSNSKVMAQWGFFMHGGSGHFTDSKGLWFSLYGDAELKLVDSEMNGFDPRDFKGIIDFENVVWKNAGEIVGNNDFVWRGSWFAQGFDPEDFSPLIWNRSQVVREFPIDIFTTEPEIVRAAKIEVFGVDNKLLSRTYTNKEGRAYFSITFNDAEFQEKFYIKVTKGDKEIRHSINFLTPTPIKLILK